MSKYPEMECCWMGNTLYHLECNGLSGYDDDAYAFGSIGTAFSGLYYVSHHCRHKVGCTTVPNCDDKEFKTELEAKLFLEDCLEIYLELLKTDGD